jgi:hypothetical protein
LINDLFSNNPSDFFTFLPKTYFLNLIYFFENLNISENNIISVKMGPGLPRRLG